MPPDLKQMERDILEAVLTLGEIGYWDNAHTAASKALIKKYLEEDESGEIDRQMLALIDFLVEKRFLVPVEFVDGKLAGGYARGITPKGYRRLRELQAPKWTWFKGNWFPVIVAGITAVIGLGAIATELYLNWE